MENNVRVETSGGLGIITLSRPDKINAILPDMVDAASAALRTWRYDTAVQAVVLRGEGERGFSAGGDLVGFHRALQDGDSGAFLDILAAEFELAAMVGSYSKPIVAIMDGLTLGAGLGIAGQASVRVVTERSRLAMPEVRIGYVPDVGGSLLLGRAEGRAGEHLAATGDQVGAGDAVELGLADFCMDSSRLPELIPALQDLAALNPHEVAVGLEIMLGSTPPAGSYAVRDSLSWINHCYAAEELPDILAELESSPWPAAQAAAERVRGNSPLAVSTALAVVRAARDEDELRGALQREHRAAAFLMENPDVAEGIRARIIDRDDNPSWNPARPEDVDAAAIQAAIEPEDEEW